MLTLTGTASLADYQAALRSVTYNDSNGDRPDDGAADDQLPGQRRASSNNLSNVAVADRQRQPEQPAVAGNVSASTDKNTAININVLASASDPDGDA